MVNKWVVSSIVTSLVISFLLGLCVGFILYKRAMAVTIAQAISCGVGQGLISRSEFKKCETFECEIDVYSKICKRALVKYSDVK